MLHNDNFTYAAPLTKVRDKLGEPAVHCKS